MLGNSATNFAVDSTEDTYDAPVEIEGAVVDTPDTPPNTPHLDGYELFGESSLVDNERQKLRTMYSDKLRLSRAIINLYKKIFTAASKSLFDMDYEEVKRQTNMSDLNFNPEELVSGLRAQENAIQNYKQAVNSKTLALPALIDFMFIYYVHSGNQREGEFIPVYKLPSSPLKLGLIYSAAKKTNDEINRVFAAFLRDEFVVDLYQDPPFYMRTDMTIDEIEAKILTYKDMIKNTINLILKTSNKPVIV
jgi:hypothetical protein